MKQKQFLYKIPQGTEGLLWEEAYRRQAMLRGIQDIFTTWGYLPVQTPVFDFYDLYAPLITPQAQEKIYRLVDREGDLLMLRSDLTLFLARSLGVSLSPGHQPLRVCYADTILRHQNLEDVSANEFFQVGAEFVGSQSPEGDWEILLLIEALLDYLKLPQARIHLGSRALVQATGISETVLPGLLTSLSMRRWNESLEILQKAGVKDAPTWMKVFSFVGSSAEGTQLLKDLPSSFSPTALKGIQEVLTTASTVEKLTAPDRIRVDFSEVGRQNYYTGLVFQVYTPGAGDAVAAGGRYDRLFSSFGLDTPSVGFSLHLKKIEHLAGDQHRFASPGTTAKAAEGDFSQRFKAAQVLRRQGKTAIL